VKHKVKNNQEEYITRASLHHTKDEVIQCEKFVKSKESESKIYLKATIEESWYINFNADVKKT